MKTILATGGAGFIGSHTCLSLLKKDFNVVVLDSLVNSSRVSIEKVNQIFKTFKSYQKEKLIFVEGDLRDQNALNEVFMKFQKEKKYISAVIHFAGLKSTNESILKPLDYWDSNVKGTINLLLAMQKFSCNKIVFSSSATIYKNDSPELISENSFKFPINPYGNTKLCVETILKDLNKSSKEFSFINLRYFNPVGAHESGLIGENPKGIPRNLIPSILKVASGEIKTLPIFGNDWPTIDGTCIRDYVHVMDVADAHVQAVEKLVDTKKTIALDINIGTGEGKSVLEVLNIFEKINKVKIPFFFAKRREGDNPFVVADIKFAKKILNWSPKRSIEQSCKDVWRWFRNND